MGGAQGSMMHPYDNTDLKISDLIAIARQFTKRATWTEKVDGINITWGYKDDKFWISRNKYQLTNPVDFDTFRSSLHGHPAQLMFEKGLNMIEAIGKSNIGYLGALTRLNSADIIWINTELIDSSSPQMLRYDEDCLVVHNLFKVNSDNKKTPLIINDSFINETIIPSFNRSSTKVYGALKIHLPPVAFSYFMNFESRMYTILAECDLTPLATISDIIHTRTYKLLTDNHNMHPEYAFDIADNVSGQGKHDIRVIKRNAKNKTIVNEYGLSKNRMKVQNRVLRELKDAWLEFGSKVLEDICSTLIKDPQVADLRMQNLFQFNSEFLSTLGSTDNMYLDWCTQYKKFRAYGVPLQIIEGVTFMHGDSLYKLTGAFQLQNRLTGIARYQYGQTMKEE